MSRWIVSTWIVFLIFSIILKCSLPSVGNNANASNALLKPVGLQSPTSYEISKLNDDVSQLNVSENQKRNKALKEIEKENKSAKDVLKQMRSPSKSPRKKQSLSEMLNPKSNITFITENSRNNIRLPDKRRKLEKKSNSGPPNDLNPSTKTSETPPVLYEDSPSLPPQTLPITPLIPALPKSPSYSSNTPPLPPATGQHPLEQAPPPYKQITNYYAPPIRSISSTPPTASEPSHPAPSPVSNNVAPLPLQNDIPFVPFIPSGPPDTSATVPPPPLPLIPAKPTPLPPTTFPTVPPPLPSIPSNPTPSPLTPSSSTAPPPNLKPRLPHQSHPPPPPAKTGFQTVPPHGAPSQPKHGVKTPPPHRHTDLICVEPLTGEACPELSSASMLQPPTYFSAMRKRWNKQKKK